MIRAKEAALFIEAACEFFKLFCLVNTKQCWFKMLQYIFVFSIPKTSGLGGGIESSCWGRKSSGEEGRGKREEGKGKRRGKKGRKEEKDRREGRKGRGSEEGREKEEKREGKRKRRRKKGRERAKEEGRKMGRIKG